MDNKIKKTEMKKESPIIFSTEMVKAILAGTKTQTRRILHKNFNVIESVVRFPRVMGLEKDWGKWKITWECGDDAVVPCRYGEPGDLLWVRETWRPFVRGTKNGGYIDLIKFEADGAEFPFKHDFTYYHVRPSIHMPKSAARIWLEVIKVKAERLHDITNEDAIAEGVNHGPQESKIIGGTKTTMLIDACSEFYSLWCKINGEENFHANPWVWVIEFKVLSTNGKP
jgi:hypothetical protein